jgi:CubicO group peptidase (beta-lactamase class C family)
MLLNGGKAGSTRLLNEKTVKTMFENNTGSVVVQPQQSTNLSLSKNFPVGAGEDSGVSGSSWQRRSIRTCDAGSGTWAGIFNTHFFIDPAREIGVVVMMQTLPFL